MSFTEWFHLGSFVTGMVTGAVLYILLSLFVLYLESKKPLDLTDNDRDNKRGA